MCVRRSRIVQVPPQICISFILCSGQIQGSELGTHFSERCAERTDGVGTGAERWGPIKDTTTDAGPRWTYGPRPPDRHSHSPSSNPRDSGLGTMKMPWMARVASRLCFCRVVLRDAVERKLRGTHRPYYVKTSSYGMNASGLCLSIHGTALRALARSNSRSTSKST